MPKIKAQRIGTWRTQPLKKAVRKEKAGRGGALLHILNSFPAKRPRWPNRGVMRRRAISITPTDVVIQTRGVFKGLDPETIKWLAEDEELSGY